MFWVRKGKYSTVPELPANRHRASLLASFSSYRQTRRKWLTEISWTFLCTSTLLVLRVRTALKSKTNQFLILCSVPFKLWYLIKHKYLTDIFVHKTLNIKGYITYTSGPWSAHSLISFLEHLPYLAEHNRAKVFVRQNILSKCLVNKYL